MMDTIALRLVADVGWGLKLRVFVGAALSTVDLISDVFITYTFWKYGKEAFFKYSATMLGASVLIMCIIILLQNRKLGWKRQMLEMIPVLCGLKPAVDAFRVASDVKIEEGQLFEPLMEMVSLFKLDGAFDF